MQNNEIYLIVYHIQRYQRFRVQNFIITNDMAEVIKQINHREHFYRRQAFTTFDAAKEYLLCKMSEENLLAFGLHSAADIMPNVFYSLP